MKKEDFREKKYKNKCKTTQRNISNKPSKSMKIPVAFDMLRRKIVHFCLFLK